MSKEKTERDDQMFRDYQDGLRTDLLIEKYRVSKQRVHQILERVSRRTGEALNKRPRGGTRNLDKPNARKNVSPDLIEKVITLGMSLTEAAKRAGVGRAVIGDRVREVIGCTITEIKSNKLEVRDKTLYEKFMQGETLRELSKKEGIAFGTLSAIIFRYRKKHGLPNKRITAEGDK